MAARRFRLISDECQHCHHTRLAHGDIVSQSTYVRRCSQCECVTFVEASAPIAATDGLSDYSRTFMSDLAADLAATDPTNWIPQRYAT
jgi:hypothetical protein